MSLLISWKADHSELHVFTRSKVHVVTVLNMLKRTHDKHDVHTGGHTEGKAFVLTSDGVDPIGGWL